MNKEVSTSNPLKRSVSEMSDSSPTSVPVIKLAKTASLHPSIAGEKVRFTICCRRYFILSLTFILYLY